MAVISAAFALFVPRRSFPRGRKIEETVPKHALRLAEQQFSRALQSKDLHFLGAEGGHAHFCHPNWKVRDGANLVEFFRPFIDLPVVPIKWETVHADSVKMFK